MFEVTGLEVSGFRGFVGEREFRFEKPVVILFGENHRGKSSTLNALEWCLFGNDCIGKKTGIRERLDWEVANRHVTDGRVAVEAVFERSDGTYRVRREASGVARRPSGMVIITLPDGDKIHGDEAERRLVELFRSSFRDFMTTVYQHQEAIRAILTDEPRDRNEAIDRLLGLSEYRDLLAGIRSARLEQDQKHINDDFEGFRMIVEQSLRTHDNLMREERAKALDDGIGKEDIAEHQALRRSRDISEAVKSIAHDLGALDFKATVPRDFDEIEKFGEWVKNCTDGLWAQSPDVARQEALTTREQELVGLRGKYQAAKDTQRHALAERNELVEAHGDQAVLAQSAAAERQKVEEVDMEIRKTNARANLVREAMRYLGEAVPEPARQRCPLCGSDAPDLLAHLQREWEERIEAEIEGLEKQREARHSELRAVERLQERLGGLERDVAEADSTLKKRGEQVGLTLGRKVEKGDDPAVLLEGELNRIDSEGKHIEDAIKKKREKISRLYADLAELRIIDEIVRHERKKAAIERIWETAEFTRLDSLRDEAAVLVEDAQAIRTALAAASRDEAETKIHAAGGALDEYFCKIDKHPAIPGLAMEVREDTRTGLNSYAFRCTDGSDPMPILSQGDMNCLALSLFLGLARATRDTQTFSFLILDDPTQSLGPEMKRQLANVLDSVTSWRRLVVATPDTEFKELLMSGLSKEKAMYEFVGWSEEDGPQITRPA